MQKTTQTQKISFKMYLSTTGHVAGKLNIGLSTVEATYLVFRCVASSFDVYVCKLIYSKFFMRSSCISVLMSLLLLLFEKKVFSFCLFIIDYNTSLFFMTRKKGLNYIFTLFFLLITRNYLIIIV